MHGDQRKTRGQRQAVCSTRIQRGELPLAGDANELPGQFRQYHRRCAAFGQHAEHARRLVLHQSARKLLPDAFGNQRRGFAVHHHLAHQLQGGWCYRKIKTRGETRHAQYAHRVFGESRPDVPQYARLEVGNAAERIDDIAGVVFGQRVDREIAAREVFFQSNVGRRVKFKTVITARGLALGARQRVFLFGFRMQKYRKILADRFVAELHHFRRRGADHHEIAIGHRQAEQFIAHGAADRVYFHADEPWYSNCGSTSVSVSAAAYHSCMAGSASTRLA